MEFAKFVFGNDTGMKTMITDYGLQKSAKGTHALILVHAMNGQLGTMLRNHLPRTGLLRRPFQVRLEQCRPCPDDGSIDTAIGVFGKHEIWDGACLAKPAARGMAHRSQQRNDAQCNGL